jgi:mRNA interferase MazF
MTSRSLGKAKVGRSSVRRGEIRRYTFALPDKRRPVLILSRDSVLPRLNEVIVVPATRTIRGIDTEVVLPEDDGMPTACAPNFDHVSLVKQERLGATIVSFAESRWAEVERPLLTACGLAPGT